MNQATDAANGDISASKFAAKHSLAPKMLKEISGDVCCLVTGNIDSRFERSGRKKLRETWLARKQSEVLLTPQNNMARMKPHDGQSKKVVNDLMMMTAKRRWPNETT